MNDSAARLREQRAKLLQRRVDAVQGDLSKLDLTDTGFTSVHTEQVPVESGATFILHTLGTIGEGDTQELWEIVELGSGAYGPHKHEETPAEFYMLEGEALVVLDGTFSYTQPGARHNVPASMNHGFWMPADTQRLRFISVQLDGHRIKDDRSGEVVLDFVEDKEFEFRPVFEMLAMLHEGRTQAIWTKRGWGQVPAAEPIR